MGWYEREARMMRQGHSHRPEAGKRPFWEDEREGWGHGYILERDLGRVQLAQATAFMGSGVSHTVAFGFVGWVAGSVVNLCTCFLFLGHDGQNTRRMRKGRGA